MAVFGAASAAQAQTSVALATSDVYAIKNAMDAWLTSCSARDLDRCMSMYADDVVGVFQGAADYDFDTLKAGFALSYKKDDLDDSWSNEVEEITGSGDMAVVRSNRTLTQTPKGGGRAATLKLRTTEILRRGDDGAWMIARFVMYPN
jgi:ketosteroid isomerase-like protein